MIKQMKSPTNKSGDSTTPDFPYKYTLDEENKVVLIDGKSIGQLGRYGIPILTKEHFPGYTYKFV